MTDQIKQKFEELSEGSSHISREQMMKYMEDNGVEDSDDKVKKFFEVLDTNNDGQVSLEEFSVGYLTAKHQVLIDILPRLGQSLATVKNVKNNVKVDNKKDTQVCLKICDEDCPSFEEMPYRMSVNLGFNGSNPNQDCMKNVELVQGDRFGFYFETGEDKEEVKAQIENQLKELLEMLKEFGPDAQEHVDSLQVVSEQSGSRTFVGIDFQDSMVAQMALSFAEEIFNMMKEIQARLTFNLGTTTDLSDIENVQANQLDDAKYLLEIDSNMQSGLDVATNCLELTENKDNSIFGLLLASSVTKLNLTINFDSEKRAKCLNQVLNEQKPSGKELVENVKQFLENAEIKDQLSTFTQLQEVYNILKEHKVTKWGIFCVANNDTLVTVDLHGDMYSFVDAIGLFE